MLLNQLYIIIALHQLTDNRVIILDTYAPTAIEILCEVSCELKQYRVKYLSNVT